MRRALVAAIVVVLTAGLVGAGTVDVAGAAKKPVRVSGDVNVHGTKNVSKSSDDDLDMELDNFYFSPTFVKAKRGQTITIELENESSAPHTFTSDVLDVDQEVAPGEDDATVTITVPSKGKAFLFYCRFHQSAGMQGALYVKKGARAAT